MAWKGRARGEDLFDYSQLKAVLLNSPAHIKDNPLYQVVNQLIDGAQRIRDTSSTSITEIRGDISVIDNAIDIINVVINNFTIALLATYLTSSDESATLPNSRELLAGTNVSFDDSTPNERTINVTASVDHVVMSDGALPIPSPMDDGFGNFIYIAYTP